MTALSLVLEPDALNLKLRQYQEWAQAFGFCLQDADGNFNPTQPIDLTGYAPLLQFRTSAMARVAALTGSVDNGAITFNPTTFPQVQVSIGIDVAPGKYEWDLRLIPTDETLSIFLGRGTVQVDAEVSRNG